MDAPQGAEGRLRAEDALVRNGKDAASPAFTISSPLLAARPKTTPAAMLNERARGLSPHARSSAEHSHRVGSQEGGRRAAVVVSLTGAPSPSGAVPLGAAREHQGRASPSLSLSHRRLRPPEKLQRGVVASAPQLARKESGEEERMGGLGLGFDPGPL